MKSLNRIGSKVAKIGVAVLLTLSFGVSYASASVTGAPQPTAAPAVSDAQTLSLVNQAADPMAPATMAPCTPLSGYIQGWDGTNTCSTFLWSYVYNIVGIGGCKSTPANLTSYIYNNTNSLWRAWTGPGCTGTSGPLYAKTGGAMSGIYNNNIESIQRVN